MAKNTINPKFRLDNIRTDDGEVFLLESGVSVVIGPELSLTAMAALHRFYTTTQMPEREREKFIRDDDSHFAETTVRGVGFAAIGGRNLLEFAKQPLTEGAPVPPHVETLDRATGVLAALTTKALTILDKEHHDEAFALRQELAMQESDFETHLQAFLRTPEYAGPVPFRPEPFYRAPLSAQT